MTGYCQNRISFRLLSQEVKRPKQTSSGNTMNVLFSLALVALSLLVASANQPVLVCWNIYAPQDSICIASIYETFHDRLQGALQADMTEQNLRGKRSADDDICQEVCEMGSSYHHLWFQVGCSLCNGDQESELSSEFDSSFQQNNAKPKNWATVPRVTWRNN